MLRAVETGLPTRVVIIALFAVIILPGTISAIVLMSRSAQAERSRFQQEAREVATRPPPWWTSTYAGGRR
ncbi:MAG: hypothetical protein DCF30_20335 [Hyphomicrobiales bacterium]|nr:MAG: hypothetical protein DCF30_20335 [Hyphomicrobiales bacterium]